MGDGYSVAWRVHDAQFWGVPQRRKRIALVADFGGIAAPEILFERKSLSGDFTQSREEGQDTAADVGHGTTQPSRAISFQERAGKPGGGKGILIQDEHTGALSTQNHQSVVYGISAYDSNSMKSSNPHSGIYEAETARTLDLNGGSPACNQGGMVVLEGNGSRPSHNGDGKKESQISYTLNGTDQHAVCWDGSQVSHTLTANNAGGEQRMPDKDNFNAVISFTTEMTPKTDENEKSFSLRSRDYKDPQCITYGLDRASFNQGKNAQYDFRVEYEKISTQVAKGPGAVASFSKLIKSVVRRLTPLECERLQGFPDGWTDIGDWVDSKGKKHKGDSDSPRYKALGNSIALPFWEWMAHRICAQYDRPTTMGSLFDGIGGFPLVFSRCGCEPVWASEIEEFPIAVTKIRFMEGAQE